MVIPYEFITPKIFDTVERLGKIQIYGIYGSFGEGFLIKEDISNDSISCVGLPAVNNFCLALESAGGVVQWEQKEDFSLEIPFKSLSFFRRKRKNCWTADNPLWIEQGLYPSGLKGSENEDGSFSRV
jgi:hypothetical protein